jgi:hypothetical protein
MKGRFHFHKYLYLLTSTCQVTSTCVQVLVIRQVLVQVLVQVLLDRQLDGRLTPPEPDPNRSRPEPQVGGESQVLVDRQLAGRPWPRACVPDSARARPTPKPTRTE